MVVVHTAPAMRYAVAIPNATTAIVTVTAHVIVIAAAMVSAATTIVDVPEAPVVS